MASQPATNPVALVKGPATTQLFRCDGCGFISKRDRDLPAGGVRCGVCGTTINATNRIDYAGLGARALAVMIDIAVLAGAFVILAWLAWGVSMFLPQDEDSGVPSRGALIGLGSGLLSAYALYAWIGDVLGVTPGKFVVGIRVVRWSTWSRPGPVFGTLRLVCKLFTLSSLGIGYLMMLFDVEWRALHDRPADTRVIER